MFTDDAADLYRDDADHSFNLALFHESTGKSRVEFVFKISAQFGWVPYRVAVFYLHHSGSAA